MASSLEEDLIENRKRLAYLIYHPNEIERWEEETDENGYWLWWSGSLLGPPSPPLRLFEPDPLVPHMDLANQSDRPVSPPPHYVELSPAVPTSDHDAPPPLADQVYDDNFDNQEEGNDDQAPPPPPANPSLYPTPNITPPRPVIPPEILRLAAEIYQIPVAANGLPSRNRLRHTAGLAGEINKKTGVLCIEKRGGKLRAFAYDDRLFNDELWAYLLGD